jgi:hypothetical protein
MNRVFGKKKAPGPPPPSLGEASLGVGGHMNSMDGKKAFVLPCIFWGKVESDILFLTNQ